MSIKDRVTGRVKKAAGDLVDDPTMRQEGRKEEEKAEKREQAARHEERAQRHSRDAADLDRQTS